MSPSSPQTSFEQPKNGEDRASTKAVQVAHTGMAHCGCRYSCGECKAQLPSEHLLSIHVAEAHDSFFAAQAARKHRVYQCLVEGCRSMFASLQERTQHLTDTHRYAAPYEQLKFNSSSTNTHTHMCAHRTARALTELSHGILFDWVPGVLICLFACFLLSAADTKLLRHLCPRPTPGSLQSRLHLLLKRAWVAHVQRSAYLSW